MRIWLAYKSHPEGADDPYTSLLPVGLLTINAVLRKEGYDSAVANLSGMENSDIISQLISHHPSVVGLSQFTHNRQETIELARSVRAHLPDCFIVLGGPHATFCWQNILEPNPFINAVAVGEGEQTMLELVRHLAEGSLPSAGIPGLVSRDERGKAFFPGHRPLIENLDSLPFAGQYLDNIKGFDPRQQLEFIISSRGCPSACYFCSSPVFWGRKLRFRSPESIVAELRFLRDRFGLIYFSIRDDTFTADRQRVIKFCRLLLQEQIFILWNCQSRVNALDAEMLSWMKRAGCECIQLGVESGSIRVLESLGKRITPTESRSAACLVREAGIRLSIYLIAGTLLEDDEDIKATCHLIDVMRPGDGQVSPLAYYPGTVLFDQAVKNGTIPADLFSKENSSALFARLDKKVAKATGAMVRSLHRAAARAQFTPADFQSHKMLHGYCHAANLMAGEYFADCGDFAAAEREYREIVRYQPENPWGWLAIGELYAETGRLQDAIDAFSRLCKSVPAHEPGFRTLGELFRLAGDKDMARVNFRLADNLLESQ